MQVLAIREWMVSEGRGFVSSDELSARLSVAPAKLPQVLQPAIDREDLIPVCKGGWALLQKGGKAHPNIEPRVYLNDMMTHLELDYRVGFGSAARFYGATHRRTSTTHVVTAARSSHDLRTGPYLRKNAEPYIQIVASRMKYIQPRNRAEQLSLFDVEPVIGVWSSHWCGSHEVRYSDPQTTLFGCVDQPRYASGWDNLLNIIAEFILDEQVNVEKLAELVHLYPFSTTQRLGVLLDEISEYLEIALSTSTLRSALPQQLKLVPLSAAASGSDTANSAKLNTKWQVLMNTQIDVDAA